LLERTDVTGSADIIYFNIYIASLRHKLGQL